MVEFLVLRIISLFVQRKFSLEILLKTENSTKDLDEVCNKKKFLYLFTRDSIAVVIKI